MGLSSRLHGDRGRLEDMVVVMLNAVFVFFFFSF